MADIGDDFFSFAGSVPIATSPDKGSAVHGDGLWVHNPAQETYEGTDGVITHIAAKASGSCPYMRELLGLPPLPASTEHTSPKIEGLNQSFENSPTTTATAPHQYHQHHPPAGERPSGGCPYRGGKIDTAPLAAINLPPASEVPSKSAADAVIEGRCPVTGKVGPLPKGHPMPPASASVHSPNTTASGIAAVAVGIPRQAVADVTESHKCPFINVFASHIDSYLHRALMTSVLNRITLKSFLREKKVLQRFAINSSSIRKGDTSSAAAVSDIGDTDTNIPSASGTDAQGNPLPPDVDESAASVLRLTAEETEAKCGEILKEYISNGTARPRAAAPGNDDDGDGSPAANAPPKLTPAVAAIIAAAAANAAHIPPALRAPNTGGNAALSSVPASGTSTPTLKPRRIGEIGESEDATVGATPSAVASMLSSMRLGREVSLPMALSFLNQATNRSEERFMDMYMRVVAEACGIKPSPLPPPLRPPPRMVGPDGQPNPAAMMVLVPPTSLLTKAIADGNLPSMAVSAMPPMSSQPQVPPVGLPPHSATSTPKTFLHDVLTSLFVPRMQHFYALWLHAVEHYEGLSLVSTRIGTDDALAVEDALNRVSISAQNVLHCIRCYSKMLHYHIMDPQSMKAVIDDLINKADQFVTARKQKLQLANMIHNGNSNSSKVLPHPYPSAHRFFALATILAIRESLPFRSFIAMETGDGAALRESIVAELIRGDKLVVPMEDLPTAAVSVLERPGYAHTTSLRNCIKTALYVTALATISPVAVAGQTAKVPSPTGQNAKALPTAGRPNGTPAPANHKSVSPNSEQPKPQARSTTVGSNVPGHILQMAASAVPYQPVHQQQTIPQQQQVWHPGNGTQFTPYGPYPTAYAQPQLVYPTVHQGHPFMVPFEPFMQPQTYAHQYTMGNERQFMAVQPVPQQQPPQEQLPQQRSQVPPFYNTPSSAQSPATPMPPAPSGHLQSNVSTPTTDGTGSIYGQLQQNLIEQRAHHGSPVDPASLKCPFLRHQFPAGAPAIIPTSPHNQQSQDSSVSSIPHGPAAIGGPQTITASAAPFYPMVQAPTGQPPPASNNPFAMYYPVIAQQDLIAPVYQPKGNGIALRPPPYKQ